MRCIEFFRDKHHKPLHPQIANSKLESSNQFADTPSELCDSDQAKQEERGKQRKRTKGKKKEKKQMTEKEY